MKLRPLCLCACLGSLLHPGVLPSSPAGGSRSSPPAQAARVHRFRIGRLEMAALSDGTVALTLAALVNGIGPQALGDLLARAGLADPVVTSINAFLVETAGRRVLIDTGAGGLFAGRGGGMLPHSLRDMGLAPESIDDILLTHVHADHSGGLTVHDKPVFPNAQVWVEQAEIDHWLSPVEESQAPEHRKHSFAQGRAALAPYLQAGRVRTFRAPAQLLPGVRALPAPGHTPGHTAYAVESEGETVLVWGDIVHAAAVQFALPAATVRFDTDEPAAARQRAAVFEEAAASDWLIAAAHVDFPGLGRLRARAQGYAWEPLGSARA